MGCSSSKGADKYEDYDWRELPVVAKQAAEKLGYTKNMWDQGKEEPEIVKEYDWDDLDDEQKKAAGILGYDEEAWEKED